MVDLLPQQQSIYPMGGYLPSMAMNMWQTMMPIQCALPTITLMPTMAQPLSPPTTPRMEGSEAGWKCLLKVVEEERFSEDITSDDDVTDVARDGIDKGSHRAKRARQREAPEDEYLPSSEKARSPKLGRSHGKRKKVKRDCISRQQRRCFTKEETENLIEGVKKFGVGQWNRILHYFDFEKRTAVNLKDKWRNICQSGVRGAHYKRFKIIVPQELINETVQRQKRGMNGMSVATRLLR